MCLIFPESCNYQVDNDGVERLVIVVNVDEKCKEKAKEELEEFFTIYYNDEDYINVHLKIRKDSTC